MQIERASSDYNVSYSVNKRHGFASIDVDNWKDAKSLLRDFPPNWIFRGQGSGTWLLSTSLERASGVPMGYYPEWILMTLFERHANTILEHHTHPTNSLELLALMQHHGTPTRLLDWTVSPYIASFFAIDSSESDSAVWAIDRDWCWRAAAGQIAKHAEPMQKIDEKFIIDKFNDIFLENTHSIIMPINPESLNTRLAIQQGLFLCPGSSKTTFMKNLEGMAPREELCRRLVRIRLKQRMRWDALRDLHHMNINRHTLFPGLDGFAQSLWNRVSFTYMSNYSGIDKSVQGGFPFAAMRVRAREP